MPQPHPVLTRTRTSRAVRSVVPRSGTLTSDSVRSAVARSAFVLCGSRCGRLAPAAKVAALLALLVALQGAALWDTLCGRLLAAEPVQAGASHRGIVSAGPFQIFPENRFSNGVYLDGTLLISLPGQTILSAAEIAPHGRLIYLTRGADGKRTVGVHTPPGDGSPRITEPAKGYSYVVAGFDGQGYKKFFRITDSAITDLLPGSRTADGLTIGPKGILFFHVASSAGSGPPKPGESAPPSEAYGIRLHWLDLEKGVVHHLGRPIYNGLPTLKLAWLEDGRIQFTLTDGKSETLSVTNFK